MKHFSLNEIKQLWRRRLGLLIDDCGCAVTRHDGTSLDALITDRIRSWYATLLLTEDPALLPVRDLAAQVDTARRISSNCIEIELPEKGVRPLSVKLTDWPLPLSRFHTPDSPEALRQRSPRLQATPRHPLAVSTGHHLLLYGLESAKAFTSDSSPSMAPDFALRQLEQLRMVAFPEEPDTFLLHTSLLNKIPTSI